jgi:hypothetical protein
MRCPRHLEIYRRPYHGDSGDAHNGLMQIPARGLVILFSNGEGWEHVSVSHKDRCPTWEEMEWVKREFWSDSDTVMQLHVPPSEHISCHPNCLHLWRPLAAEIPRPPAYMVA